jgi:hypothetical protein
MLILIADQVLLSNFFIDIVRNFRMIQHFLDIIFAIYINVFFKYLKRQFSNSKYRNIAYIQIGYDMTALYSSNFTYVFLFPL